MSPSFGNLSSWGVTITLQWHKDLTGGYLESQSVLHQGLSLARESWRWLEGRLCHWLDLFHCPVCPETSEETGTPPGEGSYWQYQHHSPARPGHQTTEVTAGCPGSQWLSVAQSGSQLWISNYQLWRFLQGHHWISDGNIMPVNSTLNREFVDPSGLRGQELVDMTKTRSGQVTPPPSHFDVEFS